MSAATIAPTPQQVVQMRVLYKVSRRQAQYRMGPSDSWHPLLISRADRALREGHMEINGVKLPIQIVPRETGDLPVHPMAAAFSSDAARINATMNQLLSGGRTR